MTEKSASTQLKHRRDEILSRVSRLVLDASGKYFRDFLLAAHDRIMEHVEQPTASKDRFELLHDRAQLNANRNNVSRIFLRSLERKYGLSPTGSPVFKAELKKLDHRNMQLVDDEDVEENVALVNARRHAEQEYNTPLWALGQRMAMLNGGEKLQIDELPMAPVHYCEALQESLSGLSTVGKLFLYKLFGQLFMSRLSRIYDVANAEFEKQGVLPNIRFNVEKSASNRYTGAAPRKDGSSSTSIYVQGGGSGSGSGGTRFSPASGGGNANGGNAGGGFGGAGSEPGSGSGTFGAGSAGAGFGSAQGGSDSAAESVKESAGAVADADAAEKLVSKIHALQNALRQGAGSNTEAPAYSPRDLQEAAKKLQQLGRHSAENLMLVTSQSVPAQDIQSNAASFQQELQVVTGDKDVALSHADMATIDLVGMLFEYILNDEQLPDCVKALLSYLHTPYLKIAFADPDFFQHDDHPARQLLNVLADAGVRWVGNDGKSEYQMFHQIRTVVKRVIDEFEYESKLFAVLLMDFSSYVQKVELRVELLEKRATEKAQGEDRLREVKDRVNAEIRQRAKGLELPSPILLFLLQPWSDYMAFVLLRYGDVSESWHESLNLMEDLLWGLELSEDNSDKVRWRQHYPWIESTMEKGFEMIGYNRGKARKLKRAIDKVYDARLKNVALDDTVDATRLKLVKLAERRLEDPAKKVVNDERVQQVIEKLKLMEFGTWFEYRDGRREKVAWFNSNSLHFLFVDQSGKRTGIRTGLEIAQDMIGGEMQMIIGSTKPLVERTLESIYADLNQQAQAQGA